MTRLNETALKAELRKSHAAQAEIVDAGVPGLAVRVGRGPAATWSLVLRVRGEGGVSRRGFEKKGHRYRLTLGVYPAMSLAAARARANEFLAQAKAGESPVLPLERAAIAGSLTVAALSERFLEDYARSRNLRSTHRYQQAIATHIVPHVGHILADALDREHVRDLMRKVRIRHPRLHTKKGRARGGVEAARRALGVLRLMVGWAIDERVIERAHNPASGMQRNLPAKKRGDRVLNLVVAFDSFTRLMLLTGCRAGELAQARWSWVDFAQALLVIPAEHYKCKHVHVVPLVPQAIEILANIYRGGKGDYILSTTDGEKPIRRIAK
jgi:hypothetical protein